MNFRQEMEMDYAIQPKAPKAPCRKRDQSLQKLPDGTTTLGRRKVKIHTIYRNPPEFSDEESKFINTMKNDRKHTEDFKLSGLKVSSLD